MATTKIVPHPDSNNLGLPILENVPTPELKVEELAISNDNDKYLDLLQQGRTLCQTKLQELGLGIPITNLVELCQNQCTKRNIRKYPLEIKHTTWHGYHFGGGEWREGTRDVPHQDCTPYDE